MATVAVRTTRIILSFSFVNIVFVYSVHSVSWAAIKRLELDSQLPTNY